MRFPESELLFGDEWIQLRKANGRYTFSHEVRCDGKIVVVLPFEKEPNSELHVLARVEETPCWEGDKPLACSLTGGIDAGETPEEAAIKELREEIGFVVTEKDLISLGTMYATKSTDTVYYIFAVQITKETEKVDPTDKNSLGVWMNLKDLSKTVDPFLLAGSLRLQHKLMETKTCNSCLHVKLVSDPDPDDWFNNDDLALVCKLMKPLENQFLSQAGLPYENALIASALRPYEVNKINRPSWCPLAINYV